jgi:flagellar biosynthesis protein FlhF
MTLKTYEAPTMAEAITQVKRDLGRDAVIVRTRRFRKGKLLGLIGGQRTWQVTAGPHEAAMPPPAAGRYAADEALRRMGTRRPMATDPAAALSAGQDRLGAPGPLTDDVTRIRDMVEALLAMHAGQGADDLPAGLRALRRQLTRQEVAETVADGLIGELRLRLTGEQLADDGCAAARVAELIAGRIATDPAVPPPDGQAARVLAFIGPTGVGKTTTIAKLAANLKLRESRRVGLITIDTYRIAAVDQLRTYAQIIEVPLEVVLTPQELQQAVAKMAGLDVVLIDTAGRSQRDQLRLNQLAAFLAAIACDQVHLVLSATATRTCLNNALERFMPLGANRIVMTKLDEAVTFGALLNVASAVEAPMSFVTCGQDVPDDIAPADPRRLAAYVLGEDARVAG